MKKNKIFFFLLLAFLFLWILTLFFFSPEEIVSFVGVETGYLFLFLTALVGVSGFASVPFYTTLVSLATSSDFNIFLLVFLVAPARSFGDILFLLMGHKGHAVLKNKHLIKFSLWIKEKPQWLISFFAYLYTSITPLPQDLLMIILGLGKANFRYIFFAVLLGNATFVAIIYTFANQLENIF